MSRTNSNGTGQLPVYEVCDVTYRYREVTALKHLNLTVNPGRRVVLLGANGSGKSTLLRILNGLCFPDEGNVYFCGRPLTAENIESDGFGLEFRRRVGLVFQNPEVQLFSPTVFDEVAFGPLQLRWPDGEIRRKISETLEMMEITHLKDRSPHHLSMGEKKRVALASVLVLDPEILLLDEPTAALDPKSESHMIDFLVQSKGSGKTIVTTTHDLDIVEDIADDCFVFHEGRIVAAAAPTEILSDVALLKQTNLLHAHLHVHKSGALHTHPHLHKHES
ncbi:MAG: energy-coupling factor ABC transporter ATP-binding protein [Acidobacteria bacterium]|nr:energy-coupling factor ABC transporter ATP-binding protein [Acidobacteriota bacterium]